MTFEEILDQAIVMLQRRGRLTYGALKRQFNLDDAYLEDLKDELIYGQQLARDEDGRVLIWTGETASTLPLSPFLHTRDHEREPLSYTPKHLAEKILTSRSALEGERKQVTVFFCDIANSTPLAEGLGPERMHNLLNQFFGLALDEVHRYEGTINQFLGDGFMALFGAPIAHEDHARRAVLAAVGLRQRIHNGPTLLGQQYGVEVAVRMSLHTGLVIVGAIGDNLRMDYTAIGATTNVAARLQKAAAPGQIVISEATYRRISGYCTTQSLGELSLKGKTEPMCAWAVLAVRETRTRLEVEAERGLTPFVGRERELQILADCFAQAQAGQGQMVFVVGEAGLGKSRLLLELRQWLNAEAIWLEGHAMSFGRSIAFHPIIDLLKRSFQIDEGDPEQTIIAKIEQGVVRVGEDLRPILPYLRYLLAVDPGDPAVRTMDPRLRRAEIFDALQRLMLRAAEVRPHILAFEDLHWMDKATEECLAFLVDSIPTSRILCLCTYRPGYIHPFGDQTYHTRVALSTLSAADSVQMVKGMLAAASLPAELEALIVQKAEGNPFFVEEVIKSLQEVRVVQREGERYVLTKPLGEIVVPDTIQDLLMARIDRLEQAPKRTLQLASVIGREFTRRLLDRLSDLQESTEAYLQELKAIELIYEKHRFPEPAYMFKHALTQEVAYNSLLVQQRQELHRLIGQAVEELYVDRIAEHYEVLAYHFAKGEEWDKAFEYFRKAAEKAARAFANREAVAFYEQALEAADYLGQAIDASALMAIHEAKMALYVVLSEFEHARDEGERLLTLARQAGDREHEARALSGMGTAAFWAHDFDQALVDTRQAIEAAEAADAQPALAQALFVRGKVYGVTGRLEQAKAELDRSLGISRSGGDIATQAFPLAVVGLFKNQEGEYAEATRILAESLRIAREHQLFFPQLYGHFVYGITLTGKGDYDEAYATFTEGLALSEKVGDEVQRHRLLNSFGWLYMELGDLERALDLNQQSVERAWQLGYPEPIANAEINLGDIFLARGDLVLAQEFFDRAYHIAHDPATTDWMKWRYSTRLFASLGELWLARDKPAKALEFVEQCMEIARRTTSRKNLVKGWRLQGEIALARRQLDEAEGAIRQALTIAQAIGNPTQLWKTHLALGRLHTEMKRHEQARQAYRAAREVIDQIKVNLHNPELRASLEHSPLIQQVYDLCASA